MKARIALAAAVLALAGASEAATITVTSFLDDDVSCTLRNAIRNANAGGTVRPACAAGSPSGGNTIVLGTGTYLLTANPDGPFNLINNSITIQGNGPANTFIDGQGQDWVFDNFGTLTQTSITITLGGLTVKNGHSTGFSGLDVAGAMYVEANAFANLDNVAFTNNSVTASGGAISNVGTLTINNSTFNGNSAPNGEGGAIRNAGTLTITNSTFNGNSAIRGAAIYHVGDVAAETVNITNSTFSGNTASQLGGAIAANNGGGALGPISLSHVTIANNSASGAGGGIYRNQAGNFSIGRSIVANNTAGTGLDCNTAAGQSFNSLDYNVIGSTSGCGITGATGANFVGAVTLNALANNGGPTLTISLPAFSPARDRATCTVATDQRGVARPQGGGCDSGAYEAVPTAPQPPTIGTATAGNSQASITFTANGSGGSTFTSFTVSSSPGGITAAGASSPIIVSGLTNGTSYTFVVTAANSYGVSPPSAASNSVTPVGPPGAPTIGTATAGNGQASIAFTAGPNGGSAITSFTAISNPGGFTASGASSPLIVSGLANGTAYTFTVRATNAAGQGPASAPSNSVVPRAPLPIAGDFNSDGKPDLLWSNTANGATFVWYMNGPTVSSDAFITQVDPSWKLQGVADFNGDGKPDLVWRNTATGSTYVWYMNGTSYVSDAFLFSLPPEWVIQGVADFNGDGKPDFLLRNTNTGIGFVWFFNNATPVSDQYLFQIDPSWKVEVVGDLNGDGQPDLLFRSMASGLAFTWFTQYTGGTLSLAGSSQPMFGIDPVWEIVQLEDWNADGNRDLVFRNRTTGVVIVWYMTGTTLQGSDFITQIDPLWEIVPRR